MSLPLRLVPALAALTVAPAGVGQAAPPALLHIVDEGRCAPSSGTDDEVVVCGRRRTPDRYRIPEQLRDRGPIDARSESPVAARREADSLDRFGAQMIGPGGYLQHSRQVDCEWRAARQALQGRQPDCTVRVGPDEPGDWQRR
jgi:hypothetical protein